jgi:arsenate reductase-like glutaredoxin family protein
MNTEGFVMQDIKSEPLTTAQLEELHSRTGSYEVLFSRRAKKYKEMDLKNEVLTEKDYRRLILDEYTFLKRPVIIDGTRVLIGNTLKRVDTDQ